VTTLKLSLLLIFWLPGLWLFIVPGQSVPSASDALLDLLVWGAHMPIDPRAYTGELRAEVERYLNRTTAYRSTTTPPAFAEGAMVHAAQVSYERRLAAISDDPSASALAVAYVKDLRPCYEWEGFHDCPEREARFADEYLAAHATGPFSAYLPLLAAHRWLCTAEAYEYESRPTDAETSRRLYRERLLIAQASRVLFVRRAAESLAARGKCFATRAQ
jgi:hypothetical protein